MKNANVQKINSLGKVSRILINIIRVFLVIGMVAIIVGGVIVAFVPDDAVSIKASANAEIVLDESRISKLIKIDVDETNFKGKVFGTSYKWILQDDKNDDGNRSITFDGEFDEITGNEVKAAVIGLCVCAEIVLVILVIICAFAKKLAVALENCNSPFEENVLKNMKSFSISLIPFAAAMLLFGSLNGLTTLLGVIVIFIFITIFKYGAQLQQESDETV